MAIQTIDLGQVTGPAGYSPAASVSEAGNVVTITMADQHGTTVATVNDIQSVNGVPVQAGTVTLTGANLAVSAQDATRLDAALAGKQATLDALHPLPVTSGGTGATSTAGALTALGMVVITNEQIDAILAE